METNAEPASPGEGDSSVDTSSITDSPFPPNCPLPPSPTDSHSSNSEVIDNTSMTPIDESLINKAPTLVQPTSSTKKSTSSTKKSPKKLSKKHRKRTLIFPSPTIAEYKVRVKKLENEICFFENTIQKTKDELVSEINNESTRIKNFMKQRYDADITELINNNDALLCKIDTLEKSEKTLIKNTIPSLNGRINALEKEVSDLKAKNFKLESKFAEMQSSVCTVSDPDSNNNKDTTSHVTSPPTDNSEPGPDVRPDPSPTTASHNRHASSRSRSVSPRDQPPRPRRESREHENRDVNKTSDRQNSDPSVGDSPASYAHSPMTSDTKNRSDLKFELIDGSTHILIGDSTIRGINPHKNTSKNNKWTKVCIGGLKTTDIPTLFNETNENPNIKGVVIHTGVSDSRANPIPVKTCSDTLKHLMYKFPRAEITVSSVIPTKGKDEFGESVRQTNLNLKQACNRLNIKFINHDTSFLSRNGAPKLALYRDKVHPSPKGTAVLASDIFGNPLQSRQNPQNPPMPPSNLEDFPPLNRRTPQYSSNNASSYLNNDLANNDMRLNQPPLQSDQTNQPLLPQPITQTLQNGMINSRPPHPIINTNPFYREPLPHLPQYPFHLAQPQIPHPFIHWPYVNHLPGALTQFMN